MSDSWTNRYAKWDAFEDEDDMEEKKGKEMTPMQFDHMGEEGVVVLPDILWNGSIISRLCKLPQQAKEIWQIVVRPLRVWSASSKGASEGNDAIPCRPFCILVNDLVRCSVGGPFTYICLYSPFVVVFHG